MLFWLFGHVLELFCLLCQMYSRCHLDLNQMFKIILLLFCYYHCRCLENVSVKISKDPVRNSYSQIGADLQEALMYIRSQERRRTVCDAAPSDSSYVHNRYRHASRHGTKYCSLKSVKCHERSLPFTRFCLHRILWQQDPGVITYKKHECITLYCRIRWQG